MPSALQITQLSERQKGKKETQSWGAREGEASGQSAGLDQRGRLRFEQRQLEDLSFLSHGLATRGEVEGTLSPSLWKP